ncbi:MAG: hypothetical protein EA420_20080 [Candidatus Competibacteraceae bacterium]|nr:MAG: hypothetical protein EA420_20080 [Candidatus Competibacteraceae bacterium]
MNDAGARLGKAALLLLVGGLLGWRIVVTGLADHYAWSGNPEAALLWRADHPEALYQRADALLEESPVAAEGLLQAAAWANPTDARIYVTLAEIWAAEEERRAAALRLAEIADILGPVSSPVLAYSADFWQSQDRLDRMLERWSRLLRTQPAVARVFYPELLQLAEDPERRELLRPLLARPPPWWDGFFVHVAREAALTDTVMFLYEHRHRGEEPPSEREQGAYLDRLWREARWAEAYQAWRQGLNEQQAQALDLIYNGGFERPPTGVGFDWRLSSPRGARVETAPTYGARGQRALRVVFDGQRVRFRHVRQYLLLEPGAYRLRGRARPDSLRAALGLRWTVRCVAEGPVLAASERFLGSDQWRLFAVDFTVPEADCPAQVLTLELEGRAALDFEVEGEIWFDDLAIVSRT